MKRFNYAKINRIAENIVLADSDYIYDPDHKKKPGGGYHKTEKGWSKKEEKKETNSTQNHTKLSKPVEEMNYDEKASLVYNYKPTDADTLDKIVDNSPWSNQWMLRLNVAKHPNTSADTLDKLADDENDMVRIEVLNHKNTSKKTIRKLKKDKNKHIQYAASRRYNYGETGWQL